MILHESLIARQPIKLQEIFWRILVLTLSFYGGDETFYTTMILAVALLRRVCVNAIDR